MNNEMNACKLCPRQCGINRNETPGYCHAKADAVVNLNQLHFGEEPIISGTRGSGTVFFSGCNLGCIFCQNHVISSTIKGETKSPEELATIYLSLQERGAHNINLVTPMHFAIPVAESLRIARSAGLRAPVAINTGGYDSVETISVFDGLVDIYMPDFKFWTSNTSKELSNVTDYKEVAISAIKAMYDQVGPAELGDDGMLKRGVIVRHLHLPGKLFESKHILEYLINTYGNNIYISLMSQYTPMPHLSGLTRCPDYLKRTVNPEHYDRLIDILAYSNQENAFAQELESTGDELIPDFK